MPFEPEYMRALDRFHTEAGALKNWQDWNDFTSKWLNQTDWPQRKPKAVHDSPLILNGRSWTKTFWTYDLSAEARYQYFSVLLGVGMNVRFPHLNRPKADNFAEPWVLYCPYCEITSNQPGSPHCPGCERYLLFDFMED